jgi:hypothetical protein
VVAYEADNTATAHPEAWVAHITGTASAFTPTEAQRELFGGLPVSVDGERFEPVYLRIEPRYASSYLVYRAER